MDEQAYPKKVDGCTIMKASDGLVVQYDDTFYTLNITSAEVFEMCNGERSVRDILAEIQERFPDDDTEHHIKDCLKQLVTYGLIVA